MWKNFKDDGNKWWGWEIDGKLNCVIKEGYLVKVTFELKPNDRKGPAIWRTVSDLVKHKSKARGASLEWFRECIRDWGQDWGQIVLGFVDLGKEFWFYSNSNQTSLRGF